MSIFYLICSFCLILCFGKLIGAFISLKFDTPFLKLAFELCLGFYTSISFFAIYKTGGITISSLFILAIITWGLVLGLFKKPTYKLLDINWKEFAEVFLMIILVFAFNYWKFLSNHEITVVNWDAMSDVTRAIFLNFTGVENSNTNYIQLPSGSQPYHYFESWCVAFFAGIFRTNFWLSQGLIFQPLILGICYVNFRSLTKKNAGNFPAIVFGILLLFAGGFLTEGLRQFSFFEWTIPLRNNIIDEPWWTRLSVLYPIILSSLHLFKVNDFKNATFCLLLIPFFSVTPAIPIIGACFFTALVLILVYKKEYLNWKFLLIPILVGLSFKFFYTIFADRSDFIPLPTFQDIFDEISQIDVLKSKIIIIIEKIIQTVVLYSPYLIIICIALILSKQITINPKKWALKNKIGLLFLASLGLCSLLMWQALNFVFGASFFYYYTIIPFLNIILVYYLWEIFLRYSAPKWMLGLVFLMIGFYFFRSVEIHQQAKRDYFSGLYDSRFVNGVKQVLKIKPLPKGLILGIKLENHSEIVHPYFNDGISLCGHYIYGIIDAPALISISRADLPEKKLFSSPYSESFTKNSSFYQYYQNNKELTINEAQLKFIKEYKIKFGIVSTMGEIPANFASIIDTTIIDSKSGEKFILFK